MQAAPKVLVVGPSWVGDMIMAQSLYGILEARSPAPTIDVLAPSWSLPVLARMPEVRRGIELAVGHGALGLAARWTLGRALRGERYAEAIVLPRSLKAALVPFFARIPKRTGFRGEWRYGLLNDVRPFDRAALDQTVKRFAALGLERGAPLPSALVPPRLDTDERNLAGLRARFGLEARHATIALMPGAEYGPAKRWPAEQYAELAAGLAADGASVLVLGSAKESGLGDEVCARARHAAVRNLCGATSLADVIDLLSNVSVAVTNDSGLMHVAAAVGAHVVAIYGSSSPDFTPPLTANQTVIYRRLVCSPCFERTCPLGHLRCLKEISTGAVLEAVRQALAQQRARDAALAAPRPTRTRADG
jgi:heptosyltransferase-2